MSLSDSTAGLSPRPSKVSRARNPLAPIRLDPVLSERLVQVVLGHRLAEERLEGHPADPASARWWAFPLLDQLYTQLWEAERTIDSGRRSALQLAIRTLLGPSLDQAPFAQRAYAKPRGYAGDYELMEMIYRDGFEGDTRLGQLLHHYIVRQPGAQSVRERRAYMGRRLSELVCRDESRCRQRPFRVLALACGPARELCDLLRSRPDRPLEMTLLDQDEEALERARQNLTPLLRADDRLITVQDSVKAVLRAKGVLRGPFDVAYAMGLYDYLEQRLARRLTNRVLDHLVPGGELIVGNFSADRETGTRKLIEYALDWHLLYRTDAEMLDLVAESDAANARAVPGPGDGSIVYLHARR